MAAWIKMLQDDEASDELLDILNLIRTPQLPILMMLIVGLNGLGVSTKGDVVGYYNEGDQANAIAE